jgi:hypothetical protein
MGAEQMRQLFIAQGRSTSLYPFSDEEASYFRKVLMQLM